GEAKRRGTTVILDSNFLFIPLRFGVDIFEELQRLVGGLVRCVVPSPVVEEMRRLRRDAKPSLRKEINFALTLAERCEKVEVPVEAGEAVDDALIRLAKRWRCPVATNDTELRRRLRAEGIPVIYLRQRAYLEADGII
ncbi:nucleotide-binding protein, partial [Candidatus Bathyarchaeota archaeon]